jgi:predicted homoserine dehydrogenase-like protein
MELMIFTKTRSSGNPIRLGLVGCKGKKAQMVHLTRRMDGLDTRVTADIITERPVATLKASGVAEFICVTDHRTGGRCPEKGKYVVTQDALLLPKLESLDVLVEATGVTEVGAQVAWNSILNQKHIVMLNVETDVTVGILLHQLAQKMDCVYTVASGDEPGVCKTLYNFARTRLAVCGQRQTIPLIIMHAGFVP